MSKQTPNLTLTLTSSSEGGKLFKDWVDENTGDSGEANLQKIDGAVGSLKENISSAQKNLDSHIANLTVHVSTNEKAAWNGKADLTEGKVPVSQIPALGYDLAGSSAEVNTALNNHTANTTSHLTSSERTTWNAKVAKSTKVTVTLSASTWSSGQYRYNNSNITPTCVVELLPSSSITAEQFEALAGANIVGGTQSTGYIYLKALGDVPTINVPVQFIIRRDL